MTDKEAVKVFGKIVATYIEVAGMQAEKFAVPTGRCVYELQ